MYTLLHSLAIPNSFHFTLAIIVFLFIISALIFEWVDKTVAVVLGVLILAISNTISYKEIITFIDFKTIILLMGLMLLVQVVQVSNVLSWVNVQMVKYTHGNPLLLYLVFALMTLILSTFLANATTMLIIVPLTITLTKGMGLNPKPYIVVEIIFSVVGGTLTVIGDPANVMIGAAAQIPFLQFSQGVYIPLLFITVMYLVILCWLNWQYIRPIGKSLTKLFMTNMLISKMEHQFKSCVFNKRFATITIVVFGLTILAMILNLYNIPIEYITLLGAVVLLILTKRYIHTEEVFTYIDIHTLLFFAGLFVSVGALEKVGALEYVSTFIESHASTTLGISLLVLWIVGLLSAFIENIPLVAMLIPVLQDLIETGVITGNTEIIWFALSLGACLGGNGSLLGSSANILGAQLAAKNGVKISFYEYFIIGYPLTLLALVICSIYLYFIA